ncbi:hypothetical protein QJS10_CPA03g02212 [Acorus calamus]|uniref:ARM repeat superfamily protein n=1 Tax=Acorus calamus TaxID=4465 RepID=A0AAV9F8Y5_ACOCL|nr:hypothetical protein QJS10_CPA03g02212 [Acorus calamus]
MLKCSPSYVVKVVSSAHIFGMGDVTLRGAGIQLLSGNLSRMLLADCEQNEDAPLTISVLEFTSVLVEIGVDDSIVSPLVLFCVQYVLVNHEHWRYKSKHVRWKVTSKVFELMRKCIKEFQNIKNIGRTIQDVLLNDLSIANTLCRIMCITSQSLERLFVSHIYELKVIKGLENAVYSALDITYSLLDISKDNLSGLPVFHQVMLSSSTKPIPLFSAVVSLVSYSRNSVIQIAAAKVLSVLCNTAAKVQPYLTDSICLVSEDLQIRSLSASVHGILDVEATRNEDLFVAVIEMLTSVALYQPAFFISISSTLPYLDDKASNTQHKDIQLLKAPALGSLSSMKTGLFDSVMQALDGSRALFDSGSPILLSVLKLLKTLWQGVAQYISILEIFRNSGVFWKKLSSCFLASDAQVHPSIESLNGDDILHSAYRFKCQAMVLEIMAYDMFLQRKMTEDEMPESGINEQPKGSSEQRLSTRIADPNNPPGGSQDILSNLCESTIMGNLIQQFSSCDYRNKFIFQAKIAVNLCIVDLIAKVSNCCAGSLSLPLVEKIYQIFGKLREQPAFSSLLEHYSLYGYSDFYYHLQGELEGREISPGPFKELSKYLLQLELFKSDDRDNEGDNLSNGDVYLYDIHACRQILHWNSGIIQIGRHQRWLQRTCCSTCVKQM